MREVKVFWEDSKSYGNEWRDVEDINDIDIVSCETKGFVVFEDERKVIVAQTQGGNQRHNFIAIPKRSIVELINET